VLNIAYAVVVDLPIKRLVRPGSVDPLEVAADVPDFISNDRVERCDELVLSCLVLKHREDANSHELQPSAEEPLVQSSSQVVAVANSGGGSDHEVEGTGPKSTLVQVAWHGLICVTLGVSLVFLKFAYNPAFVTLIILKAANDEPDACKQMPGEDKGKVQFNEHVNILEFMLLHGVERVADDQVDSIIQTFQLEHSKHLGQVNIVVTLYSLSDNESWHAAEQVENHVAGEVLSQNIEVGDGLAWVGVLVREAADDDVDQEHYVHYKLHDPLVVLVSTGKAERDIVGDLEEGVD